LLFDNHIISAFLPRPSLIIVFHTHCIVTISKLQNGRADVIFIADVIHKKVSRVW